MFPKFSSDSKGQALVEFALILVVLLLFIFIIIEAGRLFQGNLTVQNAARAAGRYAMTGQFETDCLFEFPACLDARVTSIKRESRRAGGGLAIDDNAPTGEKNSYITEIYSQDNAGNWIPDDAGGPGEPIRIIVRFQMPVITPLLRPFAESVRLTGRVTVQAENFDQYGVVENSVAPPNPGNPGGGTGPPEADVAISKSATPSTVLVKYPVDYTIDVWNLGPFDAEELVTVVDTLPEGSTYVGFTPDVRGTDCTEDPVGTVTCTMPNLDKDPGPTNSATVILHTLAPADAGVITNTATIDAGPTTFDPFLPNNTTEITVTVRREWADLSVEITDIPDPVRESELLTYTVKVSNRNYEAATDVVMTSTLSADTTFDSVDDPLGICNES
ncbi:MAG TPA: DUF11 domain-containing protein, partial [Anaerolineae bacterium]|nr:DUF11 domain-containing protein [Anaerolineae bacterium]